MNKVTLFFIMACIFYLKGYAQQTEVLTLGVFHFDFPNLDMQQISEEDQIDVLSPVYQKEIELIANKLAKFRPDAIVIEHPVTGQPKVDNLFKAYLAGKHKLSKSVMQRFIVQMHGEHRLLVSKNYWKTIARNNIRILKRVLCILPTLLYISKTSPYSSKKEYFPN